MKSNPTGVYRPTVLDKSTGVRRETRVWWIRYTVAGKQLFESSGSTRVTDAVKLRNQRIGEILGPGMWGDPLTGHRKLFDLTGEQVHQRYWSPCVYIWSRSGEVLYVGSGSIGAARRPLNITHEKLRDMRAGDRLEIFECATKAECRERETALIKKLRPKLNKIGPGIPRSRCASMKRVMRSRAA